jgi:hypothetical protein
MTSCLKTGFRCSWPTVTRDTDVHTSIIDILFTRVLSVRTCTLMFAVNTFIFFTISFMDMVAVARDFRAAKKQNIFGRIGPIGNCGFGRRVALWSM